MQRGRAETQILATWCSSLLLLPLGQVATNRRLTHRGDIGELTLGLLRVEQVCLALPYGGSPQSSNNGNIAREKDVTLFATTMVLTRCVLGARSSVRDILCVIGFNPYGNPV